MASSIGAAFIAITALDGATADMPAPIKVEFDTGFVSSEPIKLDLALHDAMTSKRLSRPPGPVEARSPSSNLTTLHRVKPYRRLLVSEDVLSQANPSPILLQPVVELTIKERGLQQLHELVRGAVRDQARQTLSCLREPCGATRPISLRLAPCHIEQLKARAFTVSGSLTGVARELILTGLAGGDFSRRWRVAAPLHRHAD